MNSYCWLIKVFCAGPKYWPVWRKRIDIVSYGTDIVQCKIVFTALWEIVIFRHKKLIWARRFPFWISFLRWSGSVELHGMRDFIPSACMNDCSLVPTDSLCRNPNHGTSLCEVIKYVQLKNEAANLRNCFTTQVIDLFCSSTWILLVDDSILSIRK